MFNFHGNFILLERDRISIKDQDKITKNPTLSEMIPYNPAVIHAGCESIQHTDYNQSITDNSDLKKYLHKSGMAYKSISKMDL